ncbi:serine protein kinase RIO [Candidatus Woesearchaeota archaeon]|nr:serine protein kinase RIO [Candidatus Woesearchaeota archaeon]
MSKITREKFKTYKDVFDEFAIRTLFKLSSQGYFDDPEQMSPVSIGKESNVFWAKRGDTKVILKIYRLETCDFNRMYDYIKYDPRYTGLKKHRRKIIFAWVQREYRNLLKARQAGVRVPTPYTFLNNVLVEEFIGGKDAAPKLKDQVPRNKKKFFDELVSQIKKIYNAGLVHADLSHFNVLNHEEKPVIIDLSTCTPLDTPTSAEYLTRDVRNICNFFAKYGLKTDLEKTIKKISSQKV